MIYDICYFLLKLVSHLFFRLRVMGRENVPITGPVILASNHVSYLDPIFLGVSLPRRINYMAKDEIFRNRLFFWFLSKLQAFPVSRQRVGPSTIKRTLQLMKKGKALLLFPEGTRGDGRELQKARPGIGNIAEKSKAPVIPVYIQGAGRVLPRGSFLIRLHQVTVCFGPPLISSLSSLQTVEANATGSGNFSEQVMAGISNLRKNLEADREIPC